MLTENIKIRSFINAALTFIYVSAVACLMWYMGEYVGSAGNFAGPIGFLMLFLLSATVTGGLVLGKPALLYMDGQKADALRLLIQTVLWLFFLTLLIFCSLILSQVF